MRKLQAFTVTASEWPDINCTITEADCADDLISELNYIMLDDPSYPETEINKIINAGILNNINLNLADYGTVNIKFIYK